jgi:phosphate transport system protein
VQSSVDIALLARFYERYADQGVAAARRFFFITTGERSRASDAHT